MLKRSPQTFGLMIRFSALLLFTLASVLLLGCKLNDQPTASFDPATIAAVPIIDRVSGDDEALTEPQIELIRSAEELDELGTRLGLSEDAVDFDEQSLVVFALGTQRTGGYWARITAAQLVGDTLWVQAVANAPGEDEMVTQQITHPYTVAIIPRVGAEVQIARQVRSVTGERPEAFLEAEAD